MHDSNDEARIQQQLNRFIEYAQSTDVYFRNLVGSTALETLPIVASSPKDVATVLELLSSVAVDTEVEVRCNILGCIVHVALMLSDPNKSCETLRSFITSHILPIIVTALLDVNPSVVKLADYALIALLEHCLVPNGYVQERIWPAVVKNMYDQPSTDPIIRVITLMSKMVPWVLCETTVTLFVPLFVQLCTYPDLIPRKACASIIGDFCAVVPLETVENKLVPSFLTLCGDSMWIVRKACAEVFTSVSSAASAYTRKHHLAPAFANLLTDPMQLVSSAAFQSLGPFITTFAEPSITNLGYNHQGKLVLRHPDGFEFQLNANIELNLTERESISESSGIDNSYNLICGEDDDDDDEDEVRAVEQLEEDFESGHQDYGTLENSQPDHQDYGTLENSQPDHQDYGTSENRDNDHQNYGALVNRDQQDYDTSENQENNQQGYESLEDKQDYRTAENRGTNQLGYDNGQQVNESVDTRENDRRDYGSLENRESDQHDYKSVDNRLNDQNDHGNLDSKKTDDQCDIKDNSVEINKGKNVVLDNRETDQLANESLRETDKEHCTENQDQWTDKRDTLDKDRTTSDCRENDTRVQELNMVHSRLHQARKHLSFGLTPTDKASASAVSELKTCDDQLDEHYSEFDDKLDNLELDKETEDDVFEESQENKDEGDEKSKKPDDEKDFSGFVFWRDPIPDIEIDLKLEKKIEVSDKLKRIREVKRDKLKRSRDNNRRKPKFDDLDDDSESYDFSRNFGSKSPVMPGSPALIQNEDPTWKDFKSEVNSETYDFTKQKNQLFLAFIQHIEASNFIDVGSGNERGGSVVPDELINHFVSMSSPREEDKIQQELARHCAYNLPAVALTLGPENWTLIKQACNSLATDKQWRVRRIVASSIHELAVIVGTEVATEDLVPVFTGFIKDLDEVRIGALKHLANFLKLLKPNTRNTLLPRFSEFLKTDYKWNWRFRAELGEQLLEIINLFTPDDISNHIAHVAFKLLQDKVAHVRNVAVHLVVEMIGAISKEGVLVRSAVAELAEQFAHSTRWYKRQTFAHLCSVLVEKQALPLDMFARDLLPHLLDLSWDKVANVRLSVARTLSRHIMALDMFSNPSSPHNEVVVIVVKRLQGDKDRDVRFFATLPPQLDYTNTSSPELPESSNIDSNRLEDNEEDSLR